MSYLIFDLETTGLDSKADDAKIHVMCAITIDNDIPLEVYSPAQMISVLNEQDMIIGHNIINFDIPYLETITGMKVTTRVFDTTVIARVLYPTIPVVPGTRHQHSLEAWGIRLGELKGEFSKTTDWKHFSPEMVEYCHQDVKVTKRLYNHLTKDLSEQNWVNIIYPEIKAAQIIQKQCQRGIGFDKENAIKFLLELNEKERMLLSELQSKFPPKYVNLGEFTYKKDDAVCTKIELGTFNPDSNQQIIKRFKDKYNWNPSVFTEPTDRYPSGQPVCNEEILSGLEYPEAKLIIEISAIRKLIGFISEGKESWLKLEKNGRIHGDVITSGVVTGRMSHRRPNLAQVPSSNTEYGKRCRELFISAPNRVLVSCDAAGLENRCLAHYLARYDNGDYAKKIETIDIHQYNADILRIDRISAKTFLYAFMYGAGDKKLAAILGKKESEGKKVKEQFFKAVPGLQDLTSSVQKAAERGYLIALDGRKIPISKNNRGYETHKALNYLLQSAGAILMKRALVRADRVGSGKLDFVANIHDEFIIETEEEYSIEEGEILKDSMVTAGEDFNFRCKLDAEYKIGVNWSEVH